MAMYIFYLFEMFLLLFVIKYHLFLACLWRLRMNRHPVVQPRCARSSSCSYANTKLTEELEKKHKVKYLHGCIWWKSLVHKISNIIAVLKLVWRKPKLQVTNNLNIFNLKRCKIWTSIGSIIPSFFIQPSFENFFFFFFFVLIFKSFSFHLFFVFTESVLYCFGCLFATLFFV